MRVHTSTTHTEFKEYVVCLWLFYRRYHSAFAHSSVIALLRAQYSIQLMGKAVVVMKTRSINMSNSCVGEFLHHPWLSGSFLLMKVVWSRRRRIKDLIYVLKTFCEESAIAHVHMWVLLVTAEVWKASRLLEGDCLQSFIEDILIWPTILKWHTLVPRTVEFVWEGKRWGRVLKETCLFQNFVSHTQLCVYVCQVPEIHFPKYSSWAVNLLGR